MNKKFLFCIVYRGVTYCEVKETTEENMSEWIDYFADEGKVAYRDWETDRKSTRLNSSHSAKSRMPSSA